MVCWIIPLAATAAGFIGRKASRREGSHSFWLNIMLLGGTLFGVVDHLWYGELFFIGANWLMDLTLGGVITGGIFASWGLIAFKPKIAESIHHLSHQLGILKK